MYQCYNFVNLDIERNHLDIQSLLKPNLWIDLKKVNFGLNSILPLNILYELLDNIYFYQPFD